MKEMTEMYTCTIKWLDDGEVVEGMFFYPYDNEPPAHQFDSEDVFFYGMSRQQAIDNIGSDYVWNEFQILSVGNYIEVSNDEQ